MNLVPLDITMRSSHTRLLSRFGTRCDDGGVFTMSCGNIPSVGPMLNDKNNQSHLQLDIYSGSIHILATDQL
ncbi:hypothetical protein DPEC_G00114550 [Dallia pectoralis]|uniref:Uncharacterized protein n=1 Tax=Dallia pectoralis TaxID=75939 RepID=A0ACC2GU12_DALPE|nr:hypothetical protein DPEC_G00114550 [Dallia pectoralis]